MKQIQAITLFFILLFSLASCSNDSNDLVAKEIISEKTVLVYMAADNNLANYATENIQSMMNALGKNNVKGNLVVYLDQGGETKLIHLKKGNNGTVIQEVVKKYASQNSVSPSVMTSVIADFKSNFPAKNYGLVLWSHGYGWLPGGNNTKSIATRWFGNDGSYFMDLPDLVNALKAGPHFSYILFDACFMGGVETAYALRGCTDYLVASPAEVMGDGFPYEEIFPYLFGESEGEYIKLASTFYNHYLSQSGANQSASIACIKTAELETLAAETNRLITSHIPAVNAINATSIQYFESYSPHLFYDFGHFVDSFTTTDERVALHTQLNKVLVYKACTPYITSIIPGGGGSYRQIPIKLYSGLNCYIPQSTTVKYRDAYRQSEWYKAAGWDKTSW